MQDTTAFDHGHDHERCVRQALERAEQLCRQRGSRLTPVRRRVLDLIWQSHKPLGAYQLLEQLAAEGFNSAPPTVYRALDFLLQQGLIHRIASLNSYIGCCDPGIAHQGHFLICNRCGLTQELEAAPVSEALRAEAQAQGFRIESETVELTGQCPACREQSRE